MKSTKVKKVIHLSALFLTFLLGSATFAFVLLQLFSSHGSLLSKIGGGLIVGVLAFTPTLLIRFSDALLYRFKGKVGLFELIFGLFMIGTFVSFFGIMFLFQKEYIHALMGVSIGLTLCVAAVSPLIILGVSVFNVLLFGKRTA